MQESREEWAMRTATLWDKSVVREESLQAKRREDAAIYEKWMTEKAADVQSEESNMSIKEAREAKRAAQTAWEENESSSEYRRLGKAVQDARIALRMAIREQEN